MLDGTIEPGTPVFVGIEDAASGLLLGGWKVPSENADVIASCLSEAEKRYGQPARVLHDLSAAMSGACDQALANVPHFVCHYHLCRDVGDDLYDRPQAALNQRLQSLKLKTRLHEQRKGQTQMLRASTDPRAQFVLSELLDNRPVQGPFSETLGRKVLLALHSWILDYRSDGCRCSFPFDPYTLYLHRRVVRASDAVDRFLRNDSLARQAPIVLVNLQKLLREYRSDAQIKAAAELYERAFNMFDRLRRVLRLTPQDMDHLRQLQELPGGEQSEIKTALDQLRQELQLQSEDEGDVDGGLAEIVLKHLDKYWAHLMLETPPAAEASWKRTTNQLERHWGSLKRVRRRGHGRGKLRSRLRLVTGRILTHRKPQEPGMGRAGLGGEPAMAASSTCRSQPRSGQPRRVERASSSVPCGPTALSFAPSQQVHRPAHPGLPRALQPQGPRRLTTRPAPEATEFRNNSPQRGLPHVPGPLGGLS